MRQKPEIFSGFLCFSPFSVFLSESDRQETLKAVWLQFLQAARMTSFHPEYASFEDVVWYSIENADVYWCDKKLYSYIDFKRCGEVIRRRHKRKFLNIFCVIDYNGYSAILNFFCQLCLQLLLQSFYFLESRIR